MDDSLFRIKRIRAAIEECVGVMETYELNIAEAAYVCKSIEESCRAMVTERILDGESDGEPACIAK